MTKYKKKRPEKDEVVLDAGEITTEVTEEEDETDRYFDDSEN